MIKNKYRLVMFLYFFLWMILAYISTKGADGKPELFICGGIAGLLYIFLLPYIYKGLLSEYIIIGSVNFIFAVIIGSIIDNQLEEMAGMLPILYIVIVVCVIFTGWVVLFVSRKRKEQLKSPDTEHEK